MHGERNRGRLANALALGALALSAVEVIAPFVTASTFQQAALRRDLPAIRRLTDMPAVRGDLSRQAHRRIIDAMQTDAELLENPLAGLGLAIVPSIAERMVAATAGPEGLATLVATGSPPLTEVEANYPPPPDEHQPVARRAGYVSWTTFRFAVKEASAPNSRETGLIFTRRGPFTWRLTRIELAT